MVLVQKSPFFQLSFLGTIGQENLFYDILEQKNAFLGYKKGRSKSRKENVFYDILEQKNAFLGYKNKRFRKSKN